MMSVTNGGRLFTAAATVNIGYLTSVTSTGVVTGAGSLWDLAGNDLEIGDIGQTASNNVLSIADGGVVTNVDRLTVVDGNDLSVPDGTLWAAELDYTGDQPLAIGGGAGNAVLALTAAATSDLAPGLVVANQGTLRGTGTLACGASGLVVRAGAALRPGIGGAGTLAASGNVDLQTGSESSFQIAAATAPGTGWAFLSTTAGSLTLGGTLRAELTGGFVPAPADRFIIMTNTGAAVSGAFDNAAHGDPVGVYSQGVFSAIGRFTLEVTPNLVALHSFSQQTAMGTLILLK
jgi:hypothetical protein